MIYKPSNAGDALTHDKPGDTPRLEHDELTAASATDAGKINRLAVVGYMNEGGKLMTAEEYRHYLSNPAWKWVIDQHWTPVAPVYAGEFIDRPDLDDVSEAKK